MSARIDYSDDVELLLEAGESHHEIARRIGIKPMSLARSLHRHGRTDLARPFWAMAERERRRNR